MVIQNLFSSSPYSFNRKEIDLRKELSETMDGSIGEISKQVPGILRKMRRDDDGVLQRCTCRDKLTDEPDQDHYCRYCLGHGYYWDEIPITYYKNNVAFRRDEEKTREYLSHVFYLEHEIDVTGNDYIITIRLDSDGNVIIPIERDLHFKILSADPFRGENSRIEFFAIRAVEERKWSTSYGIKNRQYN